MPIPIVEHPQREENDDEADEDLEIVEELDEERERALAN